MNKRTAQTQNQKIIYLIKCFNLTESQILTRLSNHAIQLHFADFTSLIINRNDQKGIYYINRKGKNQEVNYNQCKSSKLKKKIRRFSNIIQKLSSAEQSQQNSMSQSGNSNKQKFKRKQYVYSQQEQQQQQSEEQYESYLDKQ